MEQKLARHYARVRHLRESFAEANERLVARLRRVEHAAAERTPDGAGWSAAQIGWHVAAVTTQFAGLLSGDTPGAQPLPPDFVEREWTGIAARNPRALPDVASVRATGARDPRKTFSALEAPGVPFASALKRLTPDPAPLWDPKSIGGGTSA